MTPNRISALAVLTALLIGSSSVAGTTTALIDLGRAANKTGTVGGVTYNDLSIGSGAPDTGPVPVVLNGAASTTSPAPLVDTSNALTGWTIALELISTGTSGEWGNNGGNSAPGPYPAVLSSIALTALQDNLYMNRSKRGRITLAGLDDDATYSILFFAKEVNDRDNATMSFVPVTGSGTSFVTASFQARDNETEVVDWDDVAPVGGVIAFDLQASTEGWMNFMSVQETLAANDAAVPEPASLAMLALAASGLGRYVRRRRRD